MVNVDKLYHEGIAAIRAGEMILGREKLTAVVTVDQTHEQAWVWLSAAVDNDEERILCLENALTINPENEAARRGLEKLGVEARPAPEEPTQPEPTPTEKPAEYTAAENIGSRLDSVFTVVPEKEKQLPDPVKSGEEWRNVLQDPDHVFIDAAYVKSEEPPPKRDLFDLASAWGELAMLTTSKHVEDEIKYGGFGHIIANVIAAGVIQALGALLFYAILIILPSLEIQPKLITSTAEIVSTMTGAESFVDGAENGFLNVEVFDFPDPSDTVGATGDAATAAALSLASLMGVYLVGSAILSIPIVFFSEMYNSLVVNAVSRGLGGDGDAMKTMHGMTLAAVVVRLSILPLFLIAPFLPIAVYFTFYGLIWCYQMVVMGTALGKIHDFGLFLSFGVLILSSIAASMLAGFAGFVLTLLLSLA